MIWYTGSQEKLQHSIAPSGDRTQDPSMPSEWRLSAGVDSYLTHEVSELVLVDGSPVEALLAHPYEDGYHLLPHHLRISLQHNKDDTMLEHYQL